MCCSARPPTSPTPQAGRSAARSRSTRMPNAIGRNGWREARRSASPALAFTPDQRSSAISVGGRLFDYTAYGDTINTAARLEAVNKQLGTRTCVSAAAAERATGFNGRPVGDLLLRGRSEPMRVFEPLLPEERASHHTLAYANAFSKLEAHDPAALAAFAALVGECPADALAQYHLRRLLNGGTGTRIEMT
jgi:hypothetical protein